MAKKIKKQKRVNDILLGPIERPVLRWLAPRLPGWMTPDMLTGIGLFASVLIAVSYALTGLNENFLWLASFGMVLNWFGDSLDGTVARFRKIERPRFGFFIDHVVDTVGIVLVFIGLGASPYVHMVVALLGAIVYLQASILVYLINNIKQVFELSFAVIGPTEIRLVAILLNIFLYFSEIRPYTFSFGSFTWFDIAIIAICIFVIIRMFLKALSEGRKLALEEAPQPSPPPPPALKIKTEGKHKKSDHPKEPRHAG